MKVLYRDFPGGPVVKTLPSSEGDTGWIPCESLNWKTEILSALQPKDKNKYFKKA